MAGSPWDDDVSLLLYGDYSQRAHAKIHEIHRSDARARTRERENRLDRYRDTRRRVL